MADEIRLLVLALSIGGQILVASFAARNLRTSGARGWVVRLVRVSPILLGGLVLAAYVGAIPFVVPVALSAVIVASFAWPHLVINATGGPHELLQLALSVRQVRSQCLALERSGVDHLLEAEIRVALERVTAIAPPEYAVFAGEFVGVINRWLSGEANADGAILKRIDDAEREMAAALQQRGVDLRSLTLEARSSRN